MDRLMRSKIALSLAAIGVTLGGGALAASASAATGPVTQSESYGPGGDFATYCLAPFQFGVGGGCFAVASGAVSAQATLTDDVSSSTAGEIVFATPSGETKPVSFCGSGSAAIPAGATEVFVYADGPLLASKSGCGATSSATAGTVTLTQSFPVL